MSEEHPITIEVVELPSQITRYHLVRDYLRLRKEIFIDRMSWSLGQTDGIEFDQYDTFDTTYVVAHRNGEVVGGARVKRTDKRQACGHSMYEYMIRDAHLGLLLRIPRKMGIDSTASWAAIPRLGQSGRLVHGVRPEPTGQAVSW